MVQRRTAEGLDIVEMASRSNGLFTPNYLQDAERGRVPLDDQTVDHLIRLYEVHTAGPVIPERHELVLDIDAQRISVGDTSAEFDSMHSDDVLERYVSLIYRLRGQKPGSDLVLRDRDLDVLGASLGRTETQLRTDIRKLVEAPESVLRAHQVSKGKIVAAAGILVGLTAAGTLVLVGSGGNGTMPLETSAAQPALLQTDATVASIAGATGPAIVVPSATNSARPVIVAPSVVAASADTEVVSQAVVETNPVIAPETATTDTAAAPEIVEISETPETVAVPEAAAPEIVEISETPETVAIEEPAVSPAVDFAEPTISRPDAIGAQAEALINYDFRSALPGWHFSYDEDHANFHGLTFSAEKRIVVYVEGGTTAQTAAEVLMHEVGHAIDIEHMSNDQRVQWIQMRNMPATWWPGDGLNDFSVGAGDFAEAVSAVTTGSPSNSVYGEFTAEQRNFVIDILNGV